jgi:hypothetical protein
MPYMVSLLVLGLVRDGHQVLLTAFVSILCQNNAPVSPSFITAFLCSVHFRVLSLVHLSVQSSHYSRFF